MKQQESFLDKFDVIVKLKFVFWGLLCLTGLLWLSLLNREPIQLSPRQIDVGKLYSLTVPRSLNYGLIGDGAIIFGGDLDAPESMIVVNPEFEPNGEFLPLDRNPDNVKAMLLQCLDIANISPKSLEIGNISPFEYTMRPALEFTFKYDGYVGIGYYFLLHDYSFTVACLQPIDRPTSAPKRFYQRLAFMQIGREYRTLRHERSVVDSSRVDYSMDRIQEGQNALRAAHRFFRNRNHAPENLVRSLLLFEEAFQIYAEEDEAILLSDQDREVFTAGLQERSRLFKLLRSEIRQAQMIGDLKSQQKLLRDMQKYAVLQSEADEREWAKLQLARLDDGQ